MAVLTKNEIRTAIAENKLGFEPQLDAFQLQPHAVDLRLGYTFYIPKSWKITENGREALNIDYLNDRKPTSEYFDIIELSKKQYFELLPNEFVIGTTFEKISISDLQLMAILYPRSSFNRRGLSVNLTGIIDCGYSGTLVIPIQNNTNDQVIKVYPGERVCQLVFEELSSPLTHEESQTHGVKQAKYNNSDTKNIEYKPDKDEEVEFIRTGAIDELKSKFTI